MRGLICPLCNAALKQDSEHKLLRCAAGHSYDLARQGYVNLMLSHQKKSKSPGDSADMVAARRDFLDQGYYSGLAEKMLNELTAIDCSPKPGASQSSYYFADVGCGEGYYTAKIHAHLSNSLAASATLPIISTGVDISVPAIKQACKRSAEVQWVVASGTHLPFATGSCDLVTILFCRVDLAELERVLKPGGCALIASTGNKHLIEMRRALYHEVKESQPFAYSEQLPSLSVCRHSRFSDSIQIDNAQSMAQLLKMTPHYWRTNPEQQQKLYESVPHSLTIDVDLLFLKKNRQRIV